MDLSLSKQDLAIQARARAFAEQHLFPHEIACDERKLKEKTLVEIRKQAVAHKVNAYNHSKKDGGHGYTPLQQVLICEELGKATCGLWTVVFKASTPLKHGTKWQRENFLLPFNAGKGRSCYAITEKDAGSDPSLVKTTAVRKKGQWVISGEKWFVTSANASTIVIVHAHVDGDPKQPTLFLVDVDAPGVKVKRIPQFMHSYVYEHYEMVFDQVTVDDNRRLGEVGQGFDLTKEWFTETRIEIAAHCLGAAIRATEVANDYAAERVQFGKPIRDFQAIEFMLADMAVEIMAAKSLLYRVAAEVSGGMDTKLVHARASAVKLFNSEMAGRVVDKALQILGGRGYMRENPVERLYRDVRVDRIWEGTSEIQRMVIGGQIKKRGLGSTPAGAPDLDGLNKTQAIPVPESTGFVEVPGGRIWYRSNGDRHTDRPVLVGVHGGPGVPHEYLLPLTALSGERRVILYDQLDVGKSDRPGDPKNWTVERFVAEIAALRTALGLEAIHLFGNSWGGTIAAEYAIGRPHGLQSLTLSGPLLSTARWIADNDDYIRALSPEAQEALARSGGRGAEHDPKVAMALAEYNRRHLCRADPWPDFLEAAMNGTNTAVYNTMWGPTEFICTGTLKRYDCTGRLSHIQAPTLIICGQYDESAPPSCHAFSKMIPGGQLAVIPNASHLPFIERPDPFMVILRTFLKESE